jgi:hypothetical protein
VRVGTHVQAGVVARGLDPIDVRDIHEQQLTRRPDDEPLGRLWLQRCIVRELVLGAVQSPVEACIVEWLEQIVERAGFEGTQRILVMRGHENDDVRQVRAQQLEHVEARAFGHLHVEEHQVGFPPPNDFDRLDAGAAFLDRPDIRIAA